MASVSEQLQLSLNDVNKGNDANSQLLIMKNLLDKFRDEVQ